MAYQLRSRKDPASLDTQEQTDTSKGNLTEIQVATTGHIIVVPPQLSDSEQMALPVTEANQSQAALSTTAKPEILVSTPSDFEGPTRLDPGLGSAAMPVGAPAPADTVGPSSTVTAGHDASYIRNQTPQLSDIIDISSYPLGHDSQEVKHNNTQGTTIY